MSTEQYVFVCPDENSRDQGVELPAESDGTLLLSVLQSQFEGATGIKYRNEVTGGWRAVRVSDGVLCPPEKGWADTVFVVVLMSGKGDGVSQVAEAAEEVYTAAPVTGSLDSGKRKLEDQDGPRASKNPRSQSPDNYPLKASPSSPAGENLNQEDMIVLGLEYTATDMDVKAYFEQFGVVTHSEVKKDRKTGKSRGFGFVRFGDRQVQDRVFEMENHTVKGRHVDLRYPKQNNAFLPSKLFIGCMPTKPYVVTTDELREYFGQFGRLSDVYIPNAARGFGFVTYVDSAVAQRVVNMQHALRKQTLNVSYADPKNTGSTTGGRAGGGGYNSSPQFSSSGAQPPIPRGQAPLPPPRYYSAPQAPPPQGYPVSGYDSYPRQSSPNTIMRNPVGSQRVATSPGQMVQYGDPALTDQAIHHSPYGQSNWQMR